jgi:glycosyltransferase involved in cell wall biosynthesis
MKICFLAGADSIHSVKWVRYFADRGHEVHWVSLTPPTQGDVGQAKFYRLKGLATKPLRPLALPCQLIRLRQLLARIKPEILHAHYAGTNGVLGALSGFHPFLLTAWGSDILFTAKSKIKGPLVRFALKRADLITCDADHMKAAMIKLGVDPGKITIVRFGVDTQKFRPAKSNEELRNKLGIFNSPAIISLRNLEPPYDVETLLRAVPHVLKEVPEARFVIAGKGSQEEYLKALAESLGISDSVSFIGWVANDELPQYLNSADVYVSTSLSDAGLASSAAEAMACGLPVIVTDSGENRQWVSDGESGFIIPVRDAKMLAEKIVILLRSDTKRAQLGKAGRKVIEERDNYYKEMERMEKIYQEKI